MRVNVRPGASPGSLRAPDDAHAPPAMSYIVFGPETLDEGEPATLDEVPAPDEERPVLWLNVDGLGDASLLERIGDRFGFHRLALEDVLNVPQRTKLDEYTGHAYLTLRAPRPDGSRQTEQVSMFVGRGFVVTVQERPGDCLDAVRRRIRENGPRLRNRGAAYLAYALLDVIVDSYFPVVEDCGQRLRDLESEVMKSPTEDHASEIHELRTELAGLRRGAWPLREVHLALTRDDAEILDDETKIFLRDSADHAQHVLDLIDAYLDGAAGLMDLHLSLMSQRMNEVMKVLTIIATIFIPLSFIAGVYGMNFDPAASPWNMPELGWKGGYLYVLGLMAAVVVAMLVFIHRRGWFR